MKYLFAGIGSLLLLIAVIVGANTLVKPKLTLDENSFFRKFFKDPSSYLLKQITAISGLSSEEVESGRIYKCSRILDFFSIVREMEGDLPRLKNYNGDITFQ